MSTDKKFAGRIGVPTQAQQGAKLAAFKKISVEGDDCMYVASEMAFYCHGKHKTLAGVESVVRLTLADILMMIGPCYAPILIPMVVAAQEQQKAAAKEAGAVGIVTL